MVVTAGHFFDSFDPQGMVVTAGNFFDSFSPITDLHYLHYIIYITLFTLFGEPDSAHANLPFLAIDGFQFLDFTQILDLYLLVRHYLDSD